MTTPNHRHYDALIVGARCAGAATALQLARAGARVLVVDRAAYGSDTLSTHALLRGGVMLLHSWGLGPALAATGAPAIDRAVFHYGEDVVDLSVKPKGAVDSLRAPRRDVLDGILIDAARAAGAEVHHRTRVVGVTRERDGRVTGAILNDHDSAALSRVEADRVIGADGLRSTVARLVGARSTRAGQHASAMLYAHVRGIPPDGYHWFFRPGVSAGVVPTNGDASCVFVATSRRRLQAELARGASDAFHRLATDASPLLGEALMFSEALTPIRGFPGTRGWARTATGPGWALVGDAGAFCDPIITHGMTGALRDAELLARAILDGSDRALAEYEAERDALCGDLLEIGDAIAAFDWDLPGVKALHSALDVAMSRELAAIARLSPNDRRAA